jgi:hypothetical protein
LFITLPLVRIRQIMFLPLAVLIHLSYGSNPNDVSLFGAYDPALVSTPNEIYGNCTQRIERLTARRTVLKNGRILPIRFSLEARRIKATIARERTECRETLMRAITLVESRLAIANGEISEQNNIIDTARVSLAVFGNAYMMNVERLINGQAHTSSALVDAVKHFVTQWISLANSDCTADTVKFMERSCGFLEDISALTDLLLRPFGELPPQVSVESVHAILQPVVDRIDGDWPRIDSPTIRALETKRSDLTQQLASANEYIRALST